MKIIINRTININNTKPCDEAKKGFFPLWHTRQFSEKYFNKNYSSFLGLWRSKGKNHTTIKHNKWITRQEEDIKLWYVDIDSLDDLLKLQRKYGDIIIKKYEYGGVNDEIFEIEIYDTYRE